MRKDFSYIQSGVEMSTTMLGARLLKFTIGHSGGPDGLRVTIIHSAFQITNLNVFLVAIILLSKPFLQRKVWRD